VAVTVQGTDESDPAPSIEMLIEPAERIAIVVLEGERLNEVPPTTARPRAVPV
jgi:hypothetical protein